MAAFCTNCGNKLEENQEKCPNCGKVFGTPTAQTNQTYQQGTSQTGGTQANANVTPGAKSKVAAGLLGIFLGSFGVHNFYLGYTGKAVAQLLITLLSCFILSGISYIWGLIEGIMILAGSINTDADGNPLAD